MKYLFAALATLFILFTCSKKENSIKPLAPQDIILAFGDSLTYGYNAKPEESYPAVLSHLSGHKIINEGVLGDTSKDGLGRLSPLLEDNRIKLILLCFGGNDILQGLPKTALKSNLKAMIHMAKEKKIHVLLISVPNLGLFGLSAMKLYEEVANEENVPLLSGVLANILETPSLKSDQIHPNAAGYKIMAESVYKKLQELGFI